VPKIKELNYFSKESLKGFKSYYKTFITKNIMSYKKMFDFSTNVKYLIDGSVSYFTFDDVPKKLFEYNDKSKIIICYRSPLERAISHYKMDLRMGYTDKDFKYLISDKSSFYYRQYVENSLFYKNSKKFVDFFGIDNVYFYSIANNDNLSLSKFLDIDVEINTELRVNKSQLSKNFIGAFFLKNRDVTTKIKSLFPKEMLNFWKPLIYKEDNFNLEINDFGTKILSQMVNDDWNMFNTNYIKNNKNK
jgi:hypothetical protein